MRITSVDGEVIALTRGGFICPYSSEVAGRILPEGIFEDDPEVVLCGEMVGPENPYVPKRSIPRTPSTFISSIWPSKNSRSTAGVHKTHQFAEDYGISEAPLLGEFKTSAAENIKRIIQKLGRRGREGVVMKDPENRPRP